MAERRDEPPAEGDTEESISSAVNRLAAAAESIDRRLRPVEHRSWWQTIGMGLIGVLAVSALVQAKSNGDLTSQVRDCIDPSGQCYRDSRSRTGEVERRILQDQANRSERLLRAVCAHIETQGQRPPVECSEPAPPIGTPSTPSTTTPR